MVGRLLDSRFAFLAAAPLAIPLGVVAGLFPQAGTAIVDAVRRGDAAEARRLDARLGPLWDLFREFSSLRVMYASADLLGICHAQPPRPILPLSGAARQRVAETLEALGLGG